MKGGDANSPFADPDSNSHSLIFLCSLLNKHTSHSVEESGSLRQGFWTECEACMVEHLPSAVYSFVFLCYLWVNSFRFHAVGVHPHRPGKFQGISLGQCWARLLCDLCLVACKLRCCGEGIDSCGSAARLAHNTPQQCCLALQSSGSFTLIHCKPG